MKPLLTAFILFTTAALAAAQTPTPPDNTDPQTSTLSVRSTLVLVPALVKTKHGEIVYTLKADDFALTDDGVPQTLKLEEGTDHQPLALVICVETGGSGLEHLDDYTNLSTALENFIGDVDRRVAIVAFDGAPKLVQPFTPNIDRVARVMGLLDQGDDHAGDSRRAQLLCRSPPQAAAHLSPRHPPHQRNRRRS